MSIEDLVMLMVSKTLIQPLALQPLSRQSCEQDLVHYQAVAVVVQQDHPLVISLVYQEADHGWH
jgi:hypothetical protein